MAGLAAGINRLTFKTEQGEEGDAYTRRFRLYAREDDEEDAKSPGFSGFGGGSHIQSSTSYPQDEYSSYLMGSETTYDSADQYSTLTSSSPVPRYGSGELVYPQYNHTTPQYDASGTNYPSTIFQSQQSGTMVERSSTNPSSSPQYRYDAGTTIGDSPHYTEDYQHGQQYRYHSQNYYREPANLLYSSDSSSGNSLESLSDTLRARQERQDRMREEIRRMNNIPSDVPVNLNALPDPPAGQRPTQPLATLVQLAIAGSPEFKLTQRGIREAITQRFPFYRESTKWHGSVRHMLSLKGQFIQVERPITEPGQGGYWTLDMTVTEDKRTRKRRPRGRTQRVTDTEDEFEPPVSPVAAQESTTSLRVGSNTTTSAIAASTSSAATAMIPPRHRGGRPPHTVADPARYRPRRIESDANLPLNVESMSIGTGQAAAASYSVPYIEPPPAQAPYRGTWSAHHQHHTGPSPYHHPTPYITHSSFASSSHRAEAPRPSFTMPRMPEFAPVMSAPTHEVWGSPPQAEPQASSSSSSLPRVGTGPVRTIVEPQRTFDSKGKGRAQ